MSLYAADSSSSVPYIAMYPQINATEAKPGAPIASAQQSIVESTTWQGVDAEKIKTEVYNDYKFTKYAGPALIFLGFVAMAISVVLLIYLSNWILAAPFPVPDATLLKFVLGILGGAILFDYGGIVPIICGSCTVASFMLTKKHLQKPELSNIFTCGKKESWENAVKLLIATMSPEEVKQQLSGLSPEMQQKFYRKISQDSTGKTIFQNHFQQDWVRSQPLQELRNVAATSNGIN